MKRWIKDIKDFKDQEVIYKVLQDIKDIKDYKVLKVLTHHYKDTKDSKDIKVIKVLIDQEMHGEVIKDIKDYRVLRDQIDIINYLTKAIKVIEVTKDEKCVEQQAISVKTRKKKLF